MRCGAPFCKNTTDDGAGDASTESAGISFHAFPSEVGLRAAWLRALGKQDSLLSDSAVVCSQHFLDDDICETESGLRQLATGAVPSTVQVCMICLDIDSRLFLMSKHKMEEAYEKLTGYPPCDVGNLKQALCIQCAQRLRTFSQFRDKSLRARAIMMDLVEKHELITRQHIKMINCTKNQLDNNFVVTTLGPDPCDLYIQEQQSEEQQTDSEETLQTVEVIKEGGYDSMLVDEDTAGVNDDSNAEYVNEELVASDDSILAETKIQNDALSQAIERKQTVVDQARKIQDLLKFESDLFQCCLCYEEFESEPAYERHMDTHGQAGAGDGERAASPACEARTAASSSCADTSLRARHGRPVRTARRDPQRADLQQPALGALSSARLGANSGNKVRAEQVDTVQKSEQVLDTYNNEPDKRPLDTSGVTNIHSLANCVVKLYDIFKTPNKFVPLQHEPLVIAQRAATAVSMDLNCHVASQSVDIGPVTNKTKVSNPIVSNTSQTEALPNTDTSENNLVSERNCFTCDVCKKTLKRKSLLVKHIQTHSEVKPFSCKFCQYKSNHKSALSTHMRTHTGEKRYCCKLCEYKFARNHHLLTHMRTHTGEKPFDSMSVDEDTAGVNDDSNAEYVNEELVASDDSILAETKILNDALSQAIERKQTVVDQARKIQDLLKFESDLFQCCLCYEEFESEPAYERHMDTHGQAGAGDGERAASPACEARTAASSSCPDTSLRARHGRPVRTARRDPQRADLQQPALGALSSARLGANSGNKVRAEQVDTVQKSEQVLDTYNNEPDKRPLDTSGVTNIHSLAICVVKLYDIFKTPNKFVPLQHEPLVIAQRAATAVSMDLNCHVASQSEDIGPVTNKTKVTNPIVSNTSQSEALPNTDTSENNLFSERNCFTCDVCKKTLKRKSLLVKHIQTHSEVKPFSCKFCQYKSNHKSALSTHMRTHTGEKRYCCKLCEYKSARNHHLLTHMRTHTGEKPFICKLCDYRGTCKSNLVRHMRSHTGEKPFICKLCNYRCARKSCLVSHMRTHTGAKPFACELCDYRSADQSGLRKHKRTHTGEKHFICSLCDYRCAQKPQLVIHRRSHTGEKPFACELCDYRSARKSILVRHMRTHTRVKPLTRQ